MTSPITRDVARLYTQRHDARKLIYHDKPYANFGYWHRPGMTLDEACEALTDLVARTAQLGPGDQLLEVGCGYGVGAVHYVRHYHPKKVVGVDVTDVRVQAGREYVARQGFAEQIELHTGDATELTFLEGSFTKVLAVECAFHFDTREDFFRAARRVLKPDGLLVLTDIIPRPGITPERYAQRLPPLGFDVSLDIPANLYDVNEYPRRLEHAGFTDVSVRCLTDQTLHCFGDYLEEKAKRCEGYEAEKLRLAAQRNREHVVALADYILVSARKPAA